MQTNTKATVAWDGEDSTKGIINLGIDASGKERTLPRDILESMGIAAKANINLPKADPIHIFTVIDDRESSAVPNFMRSVIETLNNIPSKPITPPAPKLETLAATSLSAHMPADKSPEPVVIPPKTTALSSPTASQHQPRHATEAGIERITAQGIATISLGKDESGAVRTLMKSTLNEQLRAARLSGNFTLPSAVIVGRFDVRYNSNTQGKVHEFLDSLNSNLATVAGHPLLAAPDPVKEAPTPANPPEPKPECNPPIKEPPPEEPQTPAPAEDPKTPPMKAAVSKRKGRPPGSKNKALAASHVERLSENTGMSIQGLLDKYYAETNIPPDHTDKAYSQLTRCRKNLLMALLHEHEGRDTGNMIDIETELLAMHLSAKGKKEPKTAADNERSDMEFMISGLSKNKDTDIGIH